MRTILLIITLISIISCTPQDATQTFETYDFKINGFKWDPNPYKFSAYIQDSVVLKKGAQPAAWDYSYIGNFKKTLEAWDTGAKARDALSQEEVQAFQKFERKNAKQVILKKAKDHEVLIINEAHHLAQHRVFTADLLEDLYQQGYRHIGMESFFASPKSDSTLLANGYPVLTNGIYMKEPQYANIVRQAVKIGYKVFGYESRGHDNSKGREINQAKNIQTYMEKNPEGKYLIHCGFAHGSEGNYGGSWEKAMAGRLTEFTGINPLTINQASYSEHSQKQFDNPYYQLVEVTEPSIFVHQDSVFGKYRNESWFDMSVFHPRTKNLDAPKWLLIGDRSIIDFDFKEADINCPCLVMAYVHGEAIGSAIPYDIRETTTKNVSLVLDKENYEVIIWNEDGKALKTKINNR